MRRRRVVTLITALLLSGCTRLLNGETITATTPDGDGTVSPSELRHHLSTEFDIVEYRRKDGGTINVKYETEASSRAALGDEIELFVGTYAEYVKDHPDAKQLNVQLSNPVDDVREWYVKAKWVRQYNDGQLGKRAVLEKVVNSIDS